MTQQHWYAENVEQIYTFVALDYCYIDGDELSKWVRCSGPTRDLTLSFFVATGRIPPNDRSCHQIQTLCLIFNGLRGNLNITDKLLHFSFQDFTFLSHAVLWYFVSLLFYLIVATWLSYINWYHVIPLMLRLARIAGNCLQWKNGKWIRRKLARTQLLRCVKTQHNAFCQARVSNMMQSMQ